MSVAGHNRSGPPVGRGSLHDSADGPRRGEPAANTRCRSRDASDDCPKTVALGQGSRSRARTHPARTRLQHAHIARTRARAQALSRAHSRSRAPSLMLGQRSWSATIRIRARLHVCTRDTYTYHACYLDAPALGHGDGGREGGMGTEISCAFYAIRNCRLGPSSCSPLHVCADLTGQPGFLEAGLVPPKVPIIGAAR